ncbi:MAG: S8 family serine peptidase [Solirubrobacteraceae bacterium]
MGAHRGSTSAAILVMSLVAALAGPPVASGAGAELGSALNELVAVEQAGDSVRDAGDAGQIVVTPGERVLVDVVVSGDLEAVAERLRAAGMEIRAKQPGPPAAVVAGYVPVDRLEALPVVPGVRGVQPVVGGGSDVGARLSQGDAAHRGPQARTLGVSGAGVKVGVVSDSINQVGTKLAGSQATGDLPANVQVLSDDTTGPVDEGRAMAEIVYDTAPGVTQMVFASGTATGAAGKASGIDALVASGVKIIADDTFYLSEPFFQDGQVSQAVDRARDAGVLYLASAGNRARQSYESTPRFPAGDGVFHDFVPTAGSDDVQTVAGVPNNGFIQIALQWDEPWGQAARNIDALLVRDDGTALPGAAPLGGTDNNTTGAKRPAEIVTWTNTSGGTVSVGLKIRRTAGSGAPAPLTTIKYIARGNFGTFAIGEFATNSDTINPDAASARGSLAVAAVRFNEPGLNDPESFSSRGLKTRLFDAAGTRLPAPLVLQKPELAAADGVATTVPGFNPFNGTSAAVPSAAGLAALAWSANPALPASAIRAVLTNPAHANDCTLAGMPDADCGFGFMFADRVVGGLDATPPAVTPTTAGPAGDNGWFTGDVALSWAVSDAESPAAVNRCAPATITSDGVTTAYCAGRSVGGTANVPAEIRRDTAPPAQPAITGISAGTFTPTTVPPAGRVGCASADATSGLASCTVTGYSAAPGTHTLTATARDTAGLTSTSNVTYTVDPPTRAASRAADIVTLPSNSACVKRSARLKIRIKTPTTGAFTAVSVKVTGVKKAKRLKKAGTITLPKLARKKVTVTVTVTFTGGRTSTIKRTYRRC